MEPNYWYDETGELIGEDVDTVREWVKAHPNYRGHIWFDHGDDGKQTDVSDLFILNLEDEDA